MLGWVIFWFLAGMFLIVAEFILPGGLCGTVGAILVIISAVLGCKAYPDYALFIILSELVGVVVCILLGLFVISRTRLGGIIRLDYSQQADQGWVAADTDETLFNAVGTATTKLRPAGIIEVNDKRVDAVTTGEYIAKGQKVKVVEVSGSRVVVEAIDEE